MIVEFESLKYLQRCLNISYSESVFLISKGASNCGPLFLCFLFKKYPPTSSPWGLSLACTEKGSSKLAICRRSGVGDGWRGGGHGWYEMINRVTIFAVIKTSLWVISVLSHMRLKLKTNWIKNNCFLFPKRKCLQWKRRRKLRRKKFSLSLKRTLPLLIYSSLLLPPRPAPRPDRISLKKRTFGSIPPLQGGFPDNAGHSVFLCILWSVYHTQAMSSWNVAKCREKIWLCLIK